MSEQRMTHHIDIDAPADTVYGIIADAAAWPHRFAPTVHAEREDLGGDTERLHLWATANDQVKAWTSRRTLAPAERRIEFRQEVSSPPVASMSGIWAIAEAGAGCRLTLQHAFTAVGDDAEGLAWIEAATDRNSHTELANIKALAEGFERINGLTFTFSDGVVIDGPATAAYDFLYEAKLWPERLPHVAKLELAEPVENVQHMSMDTLAKDGSVHTTESIRICFPAELRIVYKQLVPPSLMSVHIGQWTARPADGGGVLVTSEHTVTVNEANIAKVLGPDADVAAAKDFIRRAAGGNSAATLALTKMFVEGRDG
jgi:aromatase/bifunctional cyclase/aromatase